MPKLAKSVPSLLERVFEAKEPRRGYQTPGIVFSIVQYSTAICMGTPWCNADPSYHVQYNTIQYTSCACISMPAAAAVVYERSKIVQYVVLFSATGRQEHGRP